MAVRSELRRVWTTSDGSTYFDGDEAELAQVRIDTYEAVCGLKTNWRDMDPADIVEALLREGYKVVPIHPVIAVAG